MIDTDKYTRTGRRVLDMRGPIRPSRFVGFPWGSQWAWGWEVKEVDGDLTVFVWNPIFHLQANGVRCLAGGASAGPHALSIAIPSGIGSLVLAAKVSMDLLSQAPRPYAASTATPEWTGLRMTGSFSEGVGQNPADLSEVWIDLAVFARDGGLELDLIHGAFNPQAWML